MDDLSMREDAGTTSVPLSVPDKDPNVTLFPPPNLLPQHRPMNAVSMFPPTQPMSFLPPSGPPGPAPIAKPNPVHQQSWPPCPSCDRIFPPNKCREHLAASHCNAKLKKYVVIEGKGSRCQLCPTYRGPPGRVARHCGLFHDKIEEFMTPEERKWLYSLTKKKASPNKQNPPQAADDPPQGGQILIRTD